MNEIVHGAAIHYPAKMRNAIFPFLFCLFAGQALTQAGMTSSGENLVPNPGFESFAIPPIGWYYRGVYFSKVMKFWTSPTGGSPDAYGSGVRIPPGWAEQGFGEQVPHEGSSMAGLTLYGCAGGKPHCREYLQVLLNEPLVIGQQYRFSLWVSPLPRGNRINAIGAHFSRYAIHEIHDTLLALTPQLVYPGLAGREDGEWQELVWTFTAKEVADYLLIGNFSSDAETETRAGKDQPLPFAYYYIDDVSLTKVAPILPLPASAKPLAETSLSEGMIVPLRNIYFDFDRDELLPRSFIELEQLLQLLRDRPGLSIRINGHTDIVGTDAYNLDLSERRAGAVVNYLLAQGIDPARVTFRGFGADRPVADNDSEEGRQRNRRVEFEVLAL